MMPYSGIAETLEALSEEKCQTEKVKIIANLLKRLPPEFLRPVVRLLLGKLWPPWELREMGIGQEYVAEVLASLSDGHTDMVRFKDDPGAIALNLITNLPQQPLLPSKLDTFEVYQTFRQISAQNGPGSHHRKMAYLKGLLLNATPLEAKYIVRTSLGRMGIGLGPLMMNAAIARAFEIDEGAVKEAYARFPEQGMVALIASRDEITEVTMTPPTPIKPMTFRRGKGIEEYLGKAPERACIVWHGGLKIQAHKVNGSAFFYTSRLRNVTFALQDLAKEVVRLRGNLVIEGEFLLACDGKILPLSEVVRHINLKRSKRELDRGQPVFMVFDLLYQDGDEMLRYRYAERRKRLSRLVKGIGIANGGLSLAEETIPMTSQEAEDVYRNSQARGYQGLMVRDLEASYAPGVQSNRDFVLRVAHEDSS